ncbi:MAG: hypothetical protein RLZZ262_1797 [Bacteroidota bacterium]|jgi:hypothetical protein
MVRFMSQRTHSVDGQRGAMIFYIVSPCIRYG